MQHVREVQAALQTAAGAARVMEPVAKRKLKKEVQGVCLGNGGPSCTSPVFSACSESLWGGSGRLAMARQRGWPMTECFCSQDGLVVVTAKYGAAEAIRLAEQQERHGQQNGPPQAEASTSQAAAEPSPPHSRRFTPRSPGVQ